MKKKNIFISIAFVLLFLVLINFLIASIITQQQNQKIFKIYTGIVSYTETISNNATPEEATRQVLEQIKNPQQDESGAQILNKYGYTQDNILSYRNQNEIKNQMFWLLSIPTLIVAVMFIVLILFQKRQEKKQAKILTDYIDYMLQGNYDLDIRDNQEGTWSLLKNQIYKVTVKLKEQSKQLQRDKESLKVSLADISHQIKTPLTSLLVMNDLLMENIDEDSKDKFLEVSNNQLERIKWLIETLLKLAKFDANTIKMKEESINVKKLLEKAVEPLLIPIELKNQTLTIEGPADVNMKGDFQWTQEALTNILKNCTEHTQEGGTILIRYEDNDLYTKISIQDNGEGIPSEELPHIFKRFYRGKNTSTDSAGIGLAMAQTIFQHQNGEIKASSKQLEGTTFDIFVYKRVY